MSKVYLFVEIEVKEGKLEGFTSAIKKHAAHIRTEDGCETLELFIDTKTANRVCVWEVWRDRASWDVHMVNDASKTWQKAASEFVNGEKITVMDAL
jgi:(4S)-4-hydroxy-5-phosphonooxypentane-2,3-dione isomerase